MSGIRRVPRADDCCASLAAFRGQRRRRHRDGDRDRDGDSTNQNQTISYLITQSPLPLTCEVYLSIILHVCFITHQTVMCKSRSTKTTNHKCITHNRVLVQRPSEVPVSRKRLVSQCWPHQALLFPCMNITYPPPQKAKAPEIMKCESKQSKVEKSY